MGIMRPLVLTSLVTILVFPICMILSGNSFSNTMNLPEFPLDDGLTITFPNGGETLNGTVTIEWVLESIYLGDSPWYAVFYTPNGGTNWIQLVFITLDTFYDWNTPLYEEFGSNFLIKVIASSKSWEDKEDVSDGVFTIDNRIESSSTTTTVNKESQDQGILLVGLFGSIFILSGIGIMYYRSNPRYKDRKTFVELIRTSEAEYLKEIRNKVIIGLDNIKSSFSSQIREIPLLEVESQTSMIEYFPTMFREDLRSEMKGKTVLTLIEIAYQDPSETNPTKLAQSLKIPTPTLTREIKKLVDLQYIETFVSAQVLQDARYRNFSITSKGFFFLSTLNEALEITINRLKDKLL
ncbi:MAG: hypothetical protein ACW97Z_12040 [Candidatus Hodarchaeales archaeon]